MGTGTTLKRDSIIDAIVLAFSHSNLKDLVGTDALRSVLAGQYRDLVSQGVIHLEVVWKLLSEQPGFNEAEAQPPFCLIKQWEARLGLEVQMPASFADMSATQIMAAASHCPVPKAVRQRTLDPKGTRARLRSTLEDVGEPDTSATNEAPTRRPHLEIGLAAVAVLGFVVGGYTLASYLGGPEVESVSASSLDTGLPLASAKQLGKEVVAVLEDESFWSQDSEVLEGALEDALDRLKNKDITSLVVKDPQGNVRASVQWLGDPPSIHTRVYE